MRLLYVTDFFSYPHARVRALNSGLEQYLTEPLIIDYSRMFKHTTHTCAKIISKGR